MMNWKAEKAGKTVKINGLERFRSAKVISIPSDDSVVVEVAGDCLDAKRYVLRTFNSYVQIGGDTARPLVLEDVKRITKGKELKYRMDDDGQLVGLIQF